VRPDINPDERVKQPPIGEHIDVMRAPTQSLATNVPPEFLGLAATEPEALPGRLLYGYIRHQRANGLDASIFETALWTRVARTAAIVFMVMLAVPFALGSNRSGGGGVKTVLGVLLGVGFVLLAKVMENSGQVFNLSPIVVAWTPTLVLAALTMVVLGRAR
jgi:lipopolysaccharide export system permease protein